MPGRPRSTRICTILAVALIAATVAASAAADGDPASDYLLARDAYVPYPPPSAAATTSLTDEIASVWSAGGRVKVAVIGSRQDLGAVPSLFGQPTEYARFLATEIAFVYDGPLLVVMPAGFGFVRHAVPVPAADAVLGRLPRGSDADSLMRAGTTALAALARAGALRVKDVSPPVVSVAPLQGRRGLRMFLRYSLSDDSRSARVLITVATPAGHLLATFRTPFLGARPVTPHGVAWRVPRSSPRTLTLCVRATDRAGNRSRRACAVLTVSA